MEEVGNQTGESGDRGQVMKGPEAAGLNFRSYANLLTVVLWFLKSVVVKHSFHDRDCTCLSVKFNEF